MINIFIALLFLAIGGLGVWCYTMSGDIIFLLGQSSEYERKISQMEPPEGL